MRHSTLIFVAAAFALLTFSRLALAAWQWQRVRNAGGLLPLMLGGLRIDAHQIAVMAALPAVLSPWFGHFRSPPTRRPCTWPASSCWPSWKSPRPPSFWNTTPAPTACSSNT